MYTLELRYTTGNSYGSREETDTLGHCWESLSLAKKALQSVVEHYQLHSELGSWRPDRSRDEIYDDVKTKDWHTHITDENFKHKRDWGYVISFEMDDGSWRPCSTGMWCGYFETLHEVRIVNDGDDMCHTF